MDKVTETVIETSDESKNFFKFVFNFDDENKCELLNFFQYALLAIIPIVLILKAVKYLIPEEDESKGSLEILAECLGQIILILGLMWFVDKMIRFIPTYSKCKYSKFIPTNFVLPFLIILFTMHTKLGAKINILSERIADAWNGRTQQAPANNQNGGGVRVSQPLAGQHQPSQADYLDNTQLLPANRELTSMPAPQVPNQMPPQQSPNFNNMYQGPNTPMPDAQVPMAIQEPMAANEGMGNMFGGSSW
jgi:hypothetical protein|tara:strand:- start:223 stop:966 length:744 start_codon:yes stop_codon:yes gene_type:complete